MRFTRKIFVIIFVLLIITSRGNAQDLLEVNKLSGCWSGYWDISFFGGKCLIGLNIDVSSENNIKIDFHRITGIEEYWKCSNVSYNNNILQFESPSGDFFKLTVNLDSLKMVGLYETKERTYPTYFCFDSIATSQIRNPIFFDTITYRYTIPEQINDGFETAHMKDVRINTIMIDTLMNRITRNEYEDIRSFLVVKDGKLVIEEYFKLQTLSGFPYHLKRDELQNIYSATRTFTATLAGIAIDQDHISGVNEKLSIFYPEYSDILDTVHKKDLTIEHLLTMESGFLWTEAEIQGYNDLYDPIQSKAGAPIIKYLFERPVINPPGEKYTYNNELSTIIGDIVRRTSSVSFEEYSEKYLFKPLGISKYHWFVYPDGIAMAGNGLKMRPRDMAKLGYIYVNKGYWKNHQIISEEWIRESLKLYTDIGNNPYCYHWWLSTFFINGQRIISPNARGHYGQFIFIFPSLDMVCVVTSGASNYHKWDQPVDMVSQYLLPSVFPHTGKPEIMETVHLESKVLDTYTGIYQYEEGRFGFIGKKGNSLYYKLPGFRFNKLYPLSNNKFFSKKDNVILSFLFANEGIISHYNIINAGLEENALKIESRKGDKKNSKIIIIPRTPLIICSLIFSFVIVLCLIRYIINRIRKESLVGSIVKNNIRLSRLTVICAGMSALLGTWIIFEIIDDGIFLEETLNLGTYFAGWDEISASWIYLIISCTLIFLTFLAWIKRIWSVYRLLMLSAITIATITIIINLFGTGLITLFP